MKIKKSQGKAVEVTVNSKEENSQDFCLDFVQEFTLWISKVHRATTMRIKERFSMHKCTSVIGH